MAAKSFVLFPERDFSYNPQTDLQEVDQFGFVNLREAFEKGIIPSHVEGDEPVFNGVMNPSTLMSRVADVFDGIRKADYVKSMLSKMNELDRERAEAAAKASVQVNAPGVTE